MKWVKKLRLKLLQWVYLWQYHECQQEYDYYFNKSDPDRAMQAAEMMVYFEDKYMKVSDELREP